MCVALEGWGLQCVATARRPYPNHRASPPPPPPPLCAVDIVGQPRSAAAGGKSREDTINEIVDSIKTRLPGEYDVEAVSMQYPVKYEDSMNTVLVQVRSAM